MANDDIGQELRRIRYYDPMKSGECRARVVFCRV